MRTILAVAVTATFVLVGWWNYSTSADSGLNVAKSTDSTAVTSNARDMSTQLYVGP
jgi:hypothetical protein